MCICVSLNIHVFKCWIMHKHIHTNSHTYMEDSIPTYIHT